MSGFALRLKLHTPVILSRVVPRLDTLLQEAQSRRYQDWSQPHELPLVFDQAMRGYRGSQLIFGITATAALQAVTHPCTSGVTRLPMAEASRPPNKISLTGGPEAPRLTKHKAYLSPFLLFYGEGDGEACADQLELLGGIGREHGRGAGSFTVDAVLQDVERKWRIRAWPEGSADLPFTPVRDYLRLVPHGSEEAAVRPDRLVREGVA